MNFVASSGRRGELSDYVISASNSACSHESFNFELAESFTFQGEKLLQQHEGKAFSLQPSSIPDQCTINFTAYNGPGRRRVSKKLPHTGPEVEGFTIQRPHKLLGAYRLTGFLQIYVYCSNSVVVTTAEDINTGFKKHLRRAHERPVQYSSNAMPGSLLVFNNFCRSIMQAKITQTILYSQFRRRLL